MDEKIIINIEVGERLQGSIFKAGQPLYEDRIFITSLNIEKEESGRNGLQFDLLDENKPEIVENDLCRLVLKDGRELEIQAIKIAEVSPQFIIIFSFDPISESN